MPKLNNTGPEGKGAKTGRKLGSCRKTDEELKNSGVLGKGQGKHFHVAEAPGRGKRLKYNQNKN